MGDELERSVRQAHGSKLQNVEELGQWVDFFRQVVLTKGRQT